MAITSIRARIILLLSAVALVFAGAFLIVRALNARQEARLHARAVLDQERLAERVLRAQADARQSLASEYSQSDEMVRLAAGGAGAPDKAYLNACLTASKATGCWVYNNALKLVGMAGDRSDPGLKDAPVPKSAISGLFDSSDVCHFFAESPLGLVEVHGARIQRAAGVGPQVGYFLVGKLWTKSYLSELGALTGSSADISSAAFATPPGPDKDASASVSVQRPLTGWDGKTLGALRLVSDSHAVRIHRESARYALAGLVVFSSLFVLILGLTLIRWVRRPLDSLCKSIREEAPEALGALPGQQTEFGALARTLETFFLQQEELRVEVDERRKAEEHITQLSQDLEYRVLIRTAQLQSANAELEREVHERTRAEQQILQLNEQLKRRIDRLTALRHIDLAIASTLDLRMMVSICLKHVTHQLGVDAAAVLRYHAPGNALHYVAWQGFNGKGPVRTSMPMGEGMSGACAETQQPVFEPDLTKKRGVTRNNPVLKREKFIFYYAKPLIVKEEVKGVLEIFHRASFEPDQEWLDYLEILSGQLAIAIDNAGLLNDLQRTNAEISSAYQATIEGWSRALDMRDKETQGHSERVTSMTVQMAKMIGMTEEDLVHVQRGALLHDIGKMGVPDAILLKPGQLSDEEWVIMRSHTSKALEMLYPVEYLRPALDIPYCHHEKWDGSGYPRGLKGEEIPLAARIFAIADVFDALISDRPYRDGWPREKVVEYICEHAGTHFDPALVKVFLEMIQQDGTDISALPHASGFLATYAEAAEDADPLPLAA